MEMAMAVGVRPYLRIVVAAARVAMLVGAVMIAASMVVPRMIVQCGPMNNRATRVREAEHTTWGHASKHLREQEQRKHESRGEELHRTCQPHRAWRRSYFKLPAACGVNAQGMKAFIYRRIPLMFTCNIDQRGKTMRLVVGALVEAIGLLLGALWFLEWTPAWTAWPALAIWLAGIFILFEAVVGWCAIRALGVKTPI